ncbi:hypothetical protein O181_032741 [Austropuccinia psidii MF-1]|uniref:Uncharacterized protein n=1 Tax=Austropuccinia psidii MF-1 TaxID=1389203 RepID=A0A9Q3D305_9BASI|nr:hypothetical protein [Austropuccinia psidii MF-1]
MAEANQLQKYKAQLMTSKLINYVILKLKIVFYLQTELPLPQEASADIQKSSQKAYNNALQHKEYKMFSDLWEKLHEFLPDCEEIHGPSQNLQVTQWIESIDVKEEHDSINSRIEENNPPPPKQVLKTGPVTSSSNPNVKKKPQGQRQGTSHKSFFRTPNTHPPNGFYTDYILTPVYGQLAISCLHWPHWPILHLTKPQAIILAFGPEGSFQSSRGQCPSSHHQVPWPNPLYYGGFGLNGLYGPQSMGPSGPFWPNSNEAKRGQGGIS